MRTAVAAFVFACTALPAAAACPSLPDDQNSHYVENRTALALCQQRELALSTDRAAAEARIEVELGNLDIELQRQRMRQQQIIANWPEI